MASSQLQVANKKAIWNLYRFGTTQRDILSVVGVLFQAPTSNLHATFALLRAYTLWCVITPDAEQLARFFA